MNKDITNLSTFVNNYPITESIDTDNLCWKVDKWFLNNPDKAHFIDIYNKYRTAGTTADTTALNAYAEKVNIRPFVDFILDNITSVETIDYLYILKKIIELLIANKSYELK